VPRLRFTSVFVLLGWFAPAAVCANVVFSDSTFNLSSYTLTPTFYSPGSSIAAAQCGSCGDPGSGLQFTSTLTSGAAGASAELGAVNNSFTYAPLTQGAVLSISVSVDKNLTFSGSAVHGNIFWPTIQQDGKYYLATVSGLYYLGGTTGFLSFSQSGMTAADFVQYNFATGSFSSGNPNFDGDPMTFGFTEIFGVTSGTYQATAVYSNLSFTLVTAPASPMLTVAPGVVNFNGPANLNAPVQQGITVQNSGSGSLSFNASVVSGSPWVSISPSSGTVTPGSPITVTVTANAQGLSAGNYQDVIQFSIRGGSVNIPVAFFATNSGPILWARPGGVVFTAVQGAGSSATQTLIISNQGSSGSTVNWTVAPVTGPGIPNGNFLALGTGNGGSQSGQVQAGNVLNVPLSLNSSVTNLAAGVYYELLQVSDSLSQNSPQYVSVVLDVVPASTTVLPTVTPGGLLFVGAAGGTIASQTLTVNWSSTQAQVVQAVASLPAGQSWVNLITPAGGVASTGSPLVMNVNVSTAGLAAGVYQGTINLFGIGPPALESVNVTLILTPSTATAARVGVNPQAVRPQAAVGGCTPSALVLTETGIPNDFSVPAGWPADLVTVMTDDCGNPIDGGSVNANFSNGDAPLALDDQGTSGQYVGTWQPSNLSNTIVTLNGTAGTLKPATAKLTGLVTPNQAPFLAPNGILNNLNAVVGAALAPGTVAEAFGLGLTTSQTPVSPGVSPLPTQFQNTQLIVGGFVAPLYFLSNTQLDIELPAELATLQQYPAVSVVNGALSLPVQVSVVPAAPGVAANADGSVIAQDTNFVLIDAASPAHPGQAIIIYLAGMGATNPPVASDQVAPGNNPGDTLAQAVVQPVVQVDNQIAKLLFAGLTPGAIGLYQIDFYVPMGTAAGNATLTVSQGGVNANATTLPVVTP
jgi:uncharacterized protein (TIGR03437 family)